MKGHELGSGNRPLRFAGAAGAFLIGVFLSAPIGARPSPSYIGAIPSASYVAPPFSPIVRRHLGEPIDFKRDPRLRRMVATRLERLDGAPIADPRKIRPTAEDLRITRADRELAVAGIVLAVEDLAASQSERSAD